MQEIQFQTQTSPVTEPVMERRLFTAGAIARERLEKYLAEKLAGEFDLSCWEFYTFLLEQAKNHRVDRSGYGSLEFQSDKEFAIHNGNILSR
jgi:hypothetical protein